MRLAKSVGLGLVVSAGLLLGGGWLAAGLPTAEDGTRTVRSIAAIPHAGLRVELRGVRNHAGHLIVVVYDDASALARYDDEKIAGYAAVPAAAGRVFADFPALTTGPYAVTVFHDENNDQAFAMDGQMPLEGYGTSGARGPYDEPPFDRAAVAPGLVQVEMHYLR